MSRTGRWTACSRALLMLGRAACCLVAALHAGNASPARAAARGDITVLTRTSVLGWAFDADRPERRVQVRVRVLVAGTVLHEVSASAELARSGDDALFQDGRGHGFRVRLPAGLPAAEPVLVELGLEDGPGEWHTELVAALPDESQARLQGVALSQLYLEQDPAAHELRVFARTEPVALPEGLALGVTLGPEPGRASVPLVPPAERSEVPDAPLLRTHLVATVSLSENPSVARDVEAGRPVLVSVWVTTAGDRKARRLVAATEIVARAAAPRWAGGNTFGVSR